MRERRIIMAALALLLLAMAADRPALVDLKIDTQLAERLPTAAQAEVDLGVLGTLALGWTARRLTPSR